MHSNTLSSALLLALLAEAGSARSLNTVIEASSIAGAVASDAYAPTGSKFYTNPILTAVNSNKVLIIAAA